MNLDELARCNMSYPAAGDRTNRCSVWPSRKTPSRQSFSPHVYYACRDAEIATDGQSFCRKRNRKGRTTLVLWLAYRTPRLEMSLSECYMGINGRKHGAMQRRCAPPSFTLQRRSRTHQHPETAASSANAGGDNYSNYSRRSVCCLHVYPLQSDSRLIHPTSAQQAQD